MLKKLVFRLSVLAVILTGCDKDNTSDPTPGLPPLPDRHDICSGIEDETFRKYCYTNFDADLDGKVSPQEAAAVTRIGLSYSRVGTLAGIGYFPNLETLECQHCEQLVSADLKHNRKIATVGEETFAYCSALTDVVLPEGLVSIGESAFGRCRSLTEITIPERVAEIGEATCFGCKNLAAFHGKFASEDHKCLIADGKLIAFAPASGLKIYTIPDGVMQIGKCAFFGCRALNTIILPRSVIGIGDSAFYGCTGLADITLSSGTVSIGQYAFYGCSYLNSILIPEKVTRIGCQAFEGCEQLEFVYCAPSDPPVIGIPGWDSAKRIYVPRASAEAYKNAAYWNRYADRIVGYDF